LKKHSANKKKRRATRTKTRIAMKKRVTKTTPETVVIEKPEVPSIPIQITDFFNTDYCNFGSYDNYRKLASIVDGLKPSARKCIYIILKDKIKDLFKVQNLCARVSEKTNYIHGAVSLYGVIVGLAQNFVGTNNVPLLQRKGNFGNRLIPEASADRYIFTCSEKYLTDIFKEEDNDILIEQVFEGDVIEPKFYVPVIPLILVNGSIGLTTGFTQKILPRNPKELIEWIKCKLDKKKYTGKLLPYYNGFLGTIKETSKGVYDIYGAYEKISASRIRITDIPCGPGISGYRDLKSYLAILDKLVETKKIKDYYDYSESNQYNIEVIFYRNEKNGLDIDKDDLYKELRLVKSVNESYSSLNEENKVVEYKSIEDILNNYFKVRYKFYENRKENMINKLTNKILMEVSKYTFIKGVIDGDIVLNNKSEEQIIKKIEKIKNIIKVNDSYDYLLNMPLSSITKEKYEKLKESIKELNAQLNALKKETIEDMWKKDLEKLKF
jgi:DNA topoisomerase-2